MPISCLKLGWSDLMQFWARTSCLETFHHHKYISTTSTLLLKSDTQQLNKVAKCNSPAWPQVMRYWSLPTTLWTNQTSYLWPWQVSLHCIHFQMKQCRQLQLHTNPYQDLLSYYLSVEEYNLFVFLQSSNLWALTIRFQECSPTD